MGLDFRLTTELASVEGKSEIFHRAAAFLFSELRGGAGKGEGDANDSCFLKILSFFEVY